MQELASGYGLIEGPVWDAARGLLFSDVINGGVFSLDTSGKVETVFPHRRGIGGMAPHAAGGLVISGRNIAFKGFDGADTKVLLDNDVAPEAVGFNDLTTDAKGRIYVGSLAFSAADPDSAPKPAYLHMIDLDGSAHTLAPDIQLTNGLGFSPDGSLLYHSDSLTHAVWVYDVAADGGVGPRREFARVDTDLPGAIPDGLAVAEDGSVWVAIAHGGSVIAFAADGSERTRIAVPIPMVTSVCFGGADLRDLYIVTGSRDSGRDDAGTVYRTSVDVAGLAVAPARVPLP